MLDFDLSKMLIVGIIALIVIGPKELPAVLRTMGQVMGRMRKMASEFQGQFMAAMREAEVADIDTGLHHDITKVGADLTTQIGLGSAPQSVAPNASLTASESASQPASQHWKVPMPASVGAIEAAPPMDLTAPLVTGSAAAGEATPSKPAVKEAMLKKPSEKKSSEKKIAATKPPAKKSDVKKSPAPKSAAPKSAPKKRVTKSSETVERAP